MKKILLTSLMLTAFSAPALAEDYYVELGRTKSEDEAKAMFAELQAKHKALADYDVYPNQILMQDGSFTYRVQAGPMLDKPEAQRVCNRMNRRGVSCFVIEGFDPKNTKTFAPASSGTPDFVNSAPRERVVLPWLAATTSAPIMPSTGSVDVAEAIPVPVTAQTQEQEVVISEPTPISTAQPSAPLATVGGGWLTVQPFLDEARAQQFWGGLKNRAYRESPGLKGRVIRPVVSHDIPKVVLAVGTFASEKEAMRFCQAYIPSSEYLECNYASEPPQGEEGGARAITSSSERVDAPLPVSISDVPGDDASLYWVEVLSERSQDRALEKWEGIRTDNDDILANIRSQITSSMANPNMYVVRVGPLKSKAKAAKLCDTLKSRKVGCKLTSL